MEDTFYGGVRRTRDGGACRTRDKGVRAAACVQALQKPALGDGMRSRRARASVRRPPLLECVESLGAAVVCSRAELAEL